MNARQLEALMRRFDLVGNALVYHAFAEYMRDYRLYVEVIVGPAPSGRYVYLFKHCVEASVQTSLPEDTYRRSLDERLIDYEAGTDLDGYVWGVCWSDLNGWKRNPTSERAKDWSDRLGMEFHEMVVESNAYVVTLIFSELVVRKMPDDTLTVRMGGVWPGA